MGLITRHQGHHAFDKITVGQMAGTLFGAVGEIFHVNTASATFPGDDGNSGLDFEHPLLTITAALAKCVANRHDYILIWDYWQASGETWPISVDKNAVHILGVTVPGLPFPAIHPPSDTGAFQLTSSGQYGEIAYLTIGGGSSHGGIKMGNSGQVDGFNIHHNVFGHEFFGTPLNGIEQPVGSSRGGYGVKINDNIFLGDLANVGGKITGNAIDLLKITTEPWRNIQIEHNQFLGCAVGINMTLGLGGQILNNKFVIADSGDGEAIALLAGTLGMMVDGNVAMNGGDAAIGQQPYVDVAATNKNHWGVNWTTNAVDLPKQTA